jgi:hypothetical protein
MSAKESSAHYKILGRFWTISSVQNRTSPKFYSGDRVRKISGGSWHGHVVGFYSTELMPIGYCVESEREPGSVQIYPERALELNPEPEPSP